MRQSKVGHSSTTRPAHAEDGEGASWGKVYLVLDVAVVAVSRRLSDSRHRQRRARLLRRVNRGGPRWRRGRRRDESCSLRQVGLRVELAPRYKRLAVGR